MFIPKRVESKIPPVLLCDGQVQFKVIMGLGVGISDVIIPVKLVNPVNPVNCSVSLFRLSEPTPFVVTEPILGISLSFSGFSCRLLVIIKIPNNKKIRIKFPK